MTLKALKTRLIIKKKESEVKSAGGIFLGGAQDGASVYAEVIDVGPDVTENIRVGDIILPDWRAVVPFKHNDENFLIVEERGVLGVFEDETL